MSAHAKPFKIVSASESQATYIKQNLAFYIPRTIQSSKEFMIENSHGSQNKSKKQQHNYQLFEKKIDDHELIEKIKTDEHSHCQEQKNQFQTTLHLLKAKEKVVMKTRLQKRQKMNLSSIHRDRINRLCKNIVQKMRRTNVHKYPLQDEDIIQHETKMQREGIRLSETFSFAFDLLGFIVLCCLILFQTLAHSFPQQNIFFANYLCGAVLYHLAQIVLGFISIKQEKGKKVIFIKEIAEIYLKSSFIVDLALISAISFFMIAGNHTGNDVILFILPLKVPKLLQKLQRIERVLLTNLYYEKYISVIKIILFNFAFAHIIAILLNLMTEIDPNANWLVAKKLTNAYWFQRYVWSYYWATTIMLTIGFGDFLPTTYQEAICIIFIEIFSCIAFSYNISCLGSIISNIREQGEQIDKNRKVFDEMARKKGFSNRLTEKIENYIDQSLELKTKFNLAEEKELIESLPAQYKKELISESNMNTLKGLTFFGDLLKRTVITLSERMEKQIYTPDQIVKPIYSMFQILILERGELDYLSSKDSFNLSNIAINTVCRKENSQPLLLNLDFLTLKRSAYSIKSKVYSIIHKLSFDNFIDSLKSLPKDFEYYCFLRDQSKHKIDEYETIECMSCSGKHTLIDCPKHHFMPLKEAVIWKFIQKAKRDSNNRDVLFFRRKKYEYKPLKHKIFYVKQNISRLSCNNSFNFRQMKDQKLFKYLLSSFWHFTQEIQMREDSNSKDQLNLFKIIGQVLQNAKQNLQASNLDGFIWAVSSDKAYNFDIYFPQSNSSKIQSLPLKFTQKVCANTSFSRKA